MAVAYSLKLFNDNWTFRSGANIEAKLETIKAKYKVPHCLYTPSTVYLSVALQLTSHPPLCAE